MKKVFNLIAILSLVVVFVAMPVVTVSAMPAAAPVVQETAPDIFEIIKMLEDLAKTGATLTGFALLFAALTNAGKKFLPDLFPDGSAPKYTLGFQTLTLITLVVLQVLGRSDLVPVFDESAGLIANTVNAVVALAWQFLVARKGHQSVLAGMPVVGQSYSGRMAGEYSGELVGVELNYEEE